ncbi:MAG: NADH:ubiquinone reductase (Na(+)-transporting) subunit B [Planctomycetes bacterium]|nr:NADH:ubiquinone reductase (Na(+)-transporting) subunit B [Planctomycetota bacterium]
MIEKFIDKIGQPFSKGQALEKFKPAWSAAETFLLTPSEVTSSGPHVRDAVDLKRYMVMVVLAILPCAFFGVWNTGYQSLTAAGMDASFLPCFIQGLARFLPLYLVTLAAGGTIEAIFAVVRKHEINEGFLVTSLLFPLTLPPTLPLWMAAVGIIFGVLIGKEVFGGTGMNIFNPALTARCFLFFAFAKYMSGGTEVWVAPPLELTDSFPFYAEITVDGLSGATPLMAAYLPEVNVLEQYSTMDMFFGFIPGSIGETSAFLAFVGAIMLIIMGIGSYKTMLGCVIGALGTSSLFYLFHPEGASELATMAPCYHLIMGGFAFGAVFMATDPASSPATGKGKWIYGILIGVVAILVRTINPAYPEGMMLAILFLNLFAPLIDHYVMEGQIKRRLARG